MPARYVLVAGLTALGYLGLLAAGLAMGLHYFIAILAAQLVTIAVAFPFYRRFVFRSTTSVLSDFVRFLTVWSAGAISGIVLTPLLVEVLSWHPLVAQVVAIVVVGAASFLAHRFFSFGRRSRDQPSHRVNGRSGLDKP
jgi:putative flippase GtrA